jgi:hypothetical protein
MVTARVKPASHQPTAPDVAGAPGTPGIPEASRAFGTRARAAAAAATPAAAAMSTLARSTTQASWYNAAPRARMSVNSAARRCATSRAPSSTTTAPIAVRLTYSSSSTGSAAFSAARYGDRTAGIWEESATMTGATPGAVAIAAPEVSRPLTLASTPLAWPAVS